MKLRYRYILTNGIVEVASAGDVSSLITAIVCFSAERDTVELLCTLHALLTCFQLASHDLFTRTLIYTVDYFTPVG